MEERIYTINIRRGIIDKPRWNKSNYASKFVRNYLKKHMKVEEVKIDKSINEKIWQRGITNPIRKIRVKVTKEDDGTVKAELFEEKSENN